MRTDSHRDRHVSCTSCKEHTVTKLVTQIKVASNLSFVVVTYGAGALGSWPCDVGSRGCHIDLMYAVYHWRARELLSECFYLLSQRKKILLPDDSKHRIPVECASQ